MQGTLTPAGSVRFEHARRRLARMAAKEADQISDADVIDFLSMGDVAARKILQPPPVVPERKKKTVPVATPRRLGETKGSQTDR